MNESPSDPTIEQIAQRVRSRYRTVEEMVTAAIREAIVSGVYAPREKLPQEHLAEGLGVSRIPVRAALKHLEAEGLVVFVPHRGATVRALEAADIEEIYQLRILLETFALRSAIQLVTPDELDTLERIAEELDGVEEGTEWLALRERFYEQLYAIAKRPLTAEIIGKLRADVGRYWLSLRLSDHGSGGHRVIVEAMRAGDSEAAESWLTEHLNEVSIELQRRITDRTQQ